MWGEHERRNEWKFKNIRMKKIEKNQNNKADYKKKTRKLWKWIVIGGNFFIISRIINWVTSQFLNINFKSGSRTPALSKVEFIVTGAAITMFLVKLVFLLPLINIAHLLNSFGKSLKSNCEEELWTFGLLTQALHNCEGFFNIFRHLKLWYLWQEKWKLLISVNETLSWSYE